MKLGYKQWTAALALSAIAHVAVAGLFEPVEPAVEIAGGSPVVLSLAGNSFSDMMASGEAVETLEAVTEPSAEEAVAVDEPAEPVTAEAVEAAEPVDVAAASAVIEAAPAPPETQAVETATPVQPEVAVEAEPVAEVAAIAADVAIAAPAATVVEAEPDPVAEMEIPLPVARPVPEPEPKTASAAEKPRPVKAKPAKARPKPPAKPKAQAGNGGQSNANATRGGARAASGNSARAGNAAVSNYPGKVASKLRRALRYPAEARSQRIRGEAVVGFVVASSGSVSGVRLVRSSGSSLLDTAAIETVRRAAPFPPIPGGAGRSSWPFSVPVAFNR
ncbi:protein TonB [Hoeflea marina]|uniref:Protein TonB n=1 Tax=Hoeflea marina TaxID=274592 RepID=A0A317PQV5_9HYPH|nr:energy transducer TonB [Hoeflea marina]PWW03842.1 protein TonB [Hoeflea marina]